MPISFLLHPDEGYFESRFDGLISDSEMLQTWQEFLDGPDWVPGRDELTDLSRADLSRLTTTGLRALAEYNALKFRERGVAATRVAIYAPHPLPFGLARMYEVFTADSPEEVRVFETRQEALAWLKEGRELAGEGS